MDIVLFRENTEDVYSGVEWPAGSDGANDLIRYMAEKYGKTIRPGSAIGIRYWPPVPVRRSRSMAEPDWS